MLEHILNGNRRAIARLISQIENDQPQAQAVLTDLYPHTGRAHLVGVTGPPGAGKSSLVNQLAKAYRRQSPPKSVAIIAVDPTSPFSGGAILGDRIRMVELAGDNGVFIRSMASRGSMGGLARAVDDAAKVLDAAGFDIILIETVGAGQNEVEIARSAHTVIVVEAPGLGDEVQAIKAGILEIADIFVVNKADQPGAERAVATLKMMLGLGHNFDRQVMHHGRLVDVKGPASASSGRDGSRHGDKDAWKIPVLKTVAIKGEGIEPVTAAISQHAGHLRESGALAGRNRTRLLDELEAILQSELMKHLFSQLPPELISNVTHQLIERQVTPHAAARILLAEFLNTFQKPGFEP